MTISEPRVPGVATTYLGSINAALHGLLAEPDDTIFIGEDILDPYGGAFKAARGCSTAFPNRVISSPISEAAIVGVAAGAALRGTRVIVEIMFADFTSLAFDQLYNHLAKFRGMYAGAPPVHVVVRTAVGGGRSYGPTHSQSPEKHFAGIAGLRVVVPSELHDPGRSLRESLHCGDPVLFLEAKALYPRPLANTQALAEREWERRSWTAPDGLGRTVVLSNARGGRADVTIVTYGSMAHVVEDAAFTALLEDEIATEVIVPENLTAFDDALLDASLAGSGRLLVVEEGTRMYGIGAEIVASAAERSFAALRRAPVRLAAPDSIIPSARHLEERMLPNAADVLAAIRSLS